MRFVVMYDPTQRVENELAAWILPEISCMFRSEDRPLDDHQRADLAFTLMQELSQSTTRVIFLISRATVPAVSTRLTEVMALYNRGPGQPRVVAVRAEPMVKPAALEHYVVPSMTGVDSDIRELRMILTGERGRARSVPFPGHH